jgi:hypothetical protein
LEGGDGGEDGVDRGLRGVAGGGVVAQHGFEALGAEHIALGVERVDDAVGEEDEDVAGLGGEGELLVLGLGEEAEGEAFGGDGGYDGTVAGMAGRGLRRRGLQLLRCVLEYAPACDGFFATDASYI